ncbi:MAG: M61 family metallopeptidase [Blastocatellia bacterium]|nr:M61 family metallopeptidase [Blastocatellia bacterium]
MNKCSNHGWATRILSSILRPSFFIFLLAALSYNSIAQAAPRLDYTIGIADAARHLFHLKIQASNISEPNLDISLPSWTPGWYTIRPYAANIIRLRADGMGRRLELHALDKQTWRIATEGNRSLTIEYDYFADNLNVNGAELTEKRGFFIGTNLFVYLPGHTSDTPATLRFEIPENWRIATGLKKGNEKNVYLVRDFDNLVDCPTVMGEFDELTVTALGINIHIIIDPPGQVSHEYGEKLKNYLGRIIESQGKMFGSLPYEEYWVLYVTGKLRGGGALEHENSTNIMRPAMPADPLEIAGVTSHEHFHAWNVKRIRPAGIFRYDYSKEQYFRELWFAEGFTSYYGDLHIRRAGIRTASEYLHGLETQISRLQSTEARKWVSISDASTMTWLSYGGIGNGFANFTTDYYNKGELVGLLLDLEIRGRTSGKKSLDDVMRSLFENYYKKKRGYTNEDVEKVASEIAGRSFKDFFDRYVTGTAELDYDAALSYAGLRLVDGKIVDAEKISEAQRAIRKGWLGE